MRIIDTITLDKKTLFDLFSKCSLTPTEDPKLIKCGRIASNYTIETQEMGCVIVRLYPSTYDENLVSFETRALCFLAGQGILVPKPLHFETNSYNRTLNNELALVYPYIHGKILQQSTITKDVSEKAGVSLSKMIAASMLYCGQNTDPSGDVEFIAKLLDQFIINHPRILDEQLSLIYQTIHNEKINNWLNHTAKGIVHGDFFFENLLDVGKSTYGILDFGDAYYGSLVTDIGVGAMEFSVNDQEEWDFVNMSAFLKTNINWIQKFQMTVDRFIGLLQINCVRFAIYTIPSTLKEGKEIHDNPYLRRLSFIGTKTFLKSVEKNFP